VIDDLIDAHVHLWDLEHVHLSWFHDELGLPRRVGTEDLRRASDSVRATRARVGGAIAVQAGDTVTEARWLLAQAAADPFVSAVVLQYGAAPGASVASAWAGTMQGVIDEYEADVSAAASPEASALPEASAPLSARPTRIAGMRLATPQGAVDFGDVPGLDDLAAGLARTARILELLIRPAQLPAVAALARRHPHLSIVICHLGLGASDPDGTWRRGIDALAAASNVSAKVSGLATGLPGDGDRVADVIGVAFAAFGPERLMFGTDWPMSARALPYRDVVSRTAAALPVLSPAASRAFWGGNARRLYGLAHIVERQPVSGSPRPARRNARTPIAQPAAES
jgi:L-fuconolactonase